MMKKDVEILWNLDALIKQERDRRRSETEEKVKTVDIENEIAEYCGITTHNIRRIKRNLGDPSFKLVIKLSEYFNVSMNDLFKVKNTSEQYTYNV